MTGNRRDKPDSPVEPSENGRTYNKPDKLNSTEQREVDKDALSRAVSSSVPKEISKKDAELWVGRMGVTTGALEAALLDGDRDYLSELVAGLIDHEVDLLSFFELIIEPVSKSIGEKWMSDDLDFVETGLIYLRLQMLCNQLTERLAVRAQYSDDRLRAIFARLRGQQHLLGISIVDLLFRNAGWRVTGGAQTEADETFFDALRTQEFDLVGLAVGSASVGNVSKTIQKIRNVSLNPNVKVAIGGSAVERNSRDYLPAGADLLADTAQTAVEKAKVLIDAG